MTTPRPLDDLRVLLVFPPQGHPTQPHLALPSLKAYLAQRGIPGATVWDLNLDTYDMLLSGERLALSVERIREQADTWGLERKTVLWPEDLDRYRLYADALAAGPYVAEQIDEAKRVIRDKDAFYDREQYLWAMRTFEAGLKLISTEHHPALFTAHNYTQATSIDSSDDLFAGVDATAGNLFREFFEQHALPRIEREMPDVLGISVTYGSQLVAALTLATLVKERFPGIHITLGGGMLAYVGERLAHTGPLFERCDSIVVYEGERPLAELCEAVAAAGGVHRTGALRGQAVSMPDLSTVSNTLYLRDGTPTTSGELNPLPIDDLPTPDFDDEDLTRYFSAEIVLPIAPARGCYYEKCGFCTLYTAIGPTFRERSVDKLVEDLQTLKAKHGTPYFYFIMDDLPPLMAKRIPPAFKAAELEVYWWCDARMEERIFHPESLRDLFDAGCRKLMFGFESGSQRVLDLVEKGTNLEEAERVLRWAHEAGISATLYTMVGLPTETYDDAMATRDFIVRNADVIGEISLQIFNLDMVSPMYREPERFGIRRVLDDPRELVPGEALKNDLARYLEHESVSGMSPAEVRDAFNVVLAAANEALAARRGDNFLYYRYKSHIFLYLCRYGRDTFRVDPPLADAPSHAAGLPAHVRLRDDVTFTQLPFPYGHVKDQLTRAWSDPTPLGGVARTASSARDDAHPVQLAPTFLGFIGRQHRYFDVGEDTLRVFHVAAREGIDQASAVFGEEHRESVLSTLASAVQEGLLVHDGDA